MLGTLKTTIFPLCQSVSVVSINEDHMDITCVLPKGTVLANLIAQIEQDGTVCYVTASLESTKEPGSRKYRCHCGGEAGGRGPFSIILQAWRER